MTKASVTFSTTGVKLLEKLSVPKICQRQRPDDRVQLKALVYFLKTLLHRYDIPIHRRIERIRPQMRPRHPESSRKHKIRTV